MMRIRMKAENRNNLQNRNSDTKVIDTGNALAEDTTLILELVAQLKNQTEQVISEEGVSTLDFNSLLMNEDYTKNQIQAVQNNLENVKESSGRTKELLDKIINGLQNTASDLSDARKKNKAMVTEMQQIIEVFSQFGVMFGELTKEYGKIESLASVISGIANKTKMLSLNASIEAARAGEHGRGFAVVADEIRKLSDSTNSNAKSIMESLETMTITINKLNRKTSEGTELLPSTQKLVSDSTSVFNNIMLMEDKLLQSLDHVIISQDDNIERITDINTELLNIIAKADSDNTQYKRLVLGVQKKADYYLQMLHYLKQIEVLKEQMQ